MTCLSSQKNSTRESRHLESSPPSTLPPPVFCLNYLIVLSFSQVSLDTQISLFSSEREYTIFPSRFTAYTKVTVAFESVAISPGRLSPPPNWQNVEPNAKGEATKKSLLLPPPNLPL